MQPHLRLLLFLTVAVAYCLTHGARAADSPAEVRIRPLTFGVLNQQSSIQTAERWNPILTYLTSRTGIPLRLKMGATVDATDAMMGREEFDLVFTNHNFMPEFDGKYRVLVRWAGSSIHGAIVVRENSPVGSLNDLAGKRVAFPSPAAFVAYAVPMSAINEKRIEVDVRFSGNQEGALAQLKAGQVDAAAVNTRFLESYARRENLTYRTIFVSEPFYELPIVIHPRVPAAQRAALRQALLDMHVDPAAAPALAAAQSKGFEAADERDYDNARRIYRMIGP